VWSSIVDSFGESLGKIRMFIHPAISDTVRAIDPAKLESFLSTSLPTGKQDQGPTGRAESGRQRVQEGVSRRNRFAQQLQRRADATAHDAQRAHGSLYSAGSGRVRAADRLRHRDPGRRALEIKLQVSLERRIDQQRFDLFRRCVLHVRKNMRINIECERYAVMSQLLADDLWRDPSNQ